MSRVRWALGGLGVLVAAYGAWLALSRQDLDQLLDLALWLAGGVVLHDLVLAPLVLLFALALRRTPPAWHRPATWALVVVGSLSLLAVPVLGRFGARSDNPTLLDRPYLTSWLVLVVLTVVAVLVAGLVAGRLASRRARPAGPASLVVPPGGEDGPGAGRR